MIAITNIWKKNTALLEINRKEKFEKKFKIQEFYVERDYVIGKKVNNKNLGRNFMKDNRRLKNNIN